MAIRVPRKWLWAKVAKVAKVSAKGRPQVTGAAPEINKKACINFAA
jgi:hypothetical protein